ncbi:hypothetical protein MIDIC_140039 [Alphaproteobacteria bacterium]
MAIKDIISEELATHILNQDSLLITRLKKIMKNKLLLLQNKFLLYKRSIVKTIFGKLKQFHRLWHSTFTSVENASCNLIHTSGFTLSYTCIHLATVPYS